MVIRDHFPEVCYFLIQQNFNKENRAIQLKYAIYLDESRRNIFYKMYAISQPKCYAGCIFRIF